MKLSFAPVLFFAAGSLFALHLAEGPEANSAIDHMTADSLRGNLSFLASDALEGRDTPSRGLDVAAEFIASQFRRAGLEAPVNGSYFQTADYFRIKRAAGPISLSIDGIRIEPADVTVVRGASAINLEAVPLYKLSGDSVPDDVAGKAVFVISGTSRSTVRSLREKKPALIITTGSRRPAGTAVELAAADQADTPTTPTISVRGEQAGKLFESLEDGLTKASLTLRAPGVDREPVKLRNVIGVLPGSDPELKNTYIIVTAHYDHIGIKSTSDEDDGDRIYNGANDDGSGVVSVIELAGALATMRPHPRRTVVFMTVFGEEKGLLGSQYYGRHPIFPLRQTVADINLEQVGRTDDNDGPQIASATFTGFTYSDLPELFAAAGKALGVKVYDRNPGNDMYFARSDNQALADAGIPAHTLAVALEFPDYHQVGDEWHKIDYTNMLLVDRMVGLGIISLANDPESPRWNESNQNVSKYLDAWKRLHLAPGP